MSELLFLLLILLLFLLLTTFVSFGFDLFRPSRRARKGRRAIAFLILFTTLYLIRNSIGTYFICIEDPVEAAARAEYLRQRDMYKVIGILLLLPLQWFLLRWSQVSLVLTLLLLFFYSDTVNFFIHSGISDLW